jgi:predicted RNase H-like HicB family nuclease
MYRINLVIEKLPEGKYLGTSPDIPGLIVQADTPEEVLRLAPEIARDLIIVMAETNQPLPDKIELATSLSSIPVFVPA